MSVVDLARRRAELEQMAARGSAPAHPIGRPADMRQARRFAEAAQAAYETVGKIDISLPGPMRPDAP